MTDLWIPPHSIEAEQTVLGALLLANDAYDAVADIVTEADFYSDQNRAVFAALRELIGAGKPADKVTLLARLQECKTVDRAGGRAYIEHLEMATPSARNVTRYAQIVRERS